MKKSLIKTLITFGLIASFAPGVCAQDDASLKAPKAAEKILYARPFKVDKPIRFVIGGKQDQMVKEGYILVLQGDKAFTAPLNAPDVSIFVDNALVPKINTGYKSGVVVVMVPKCDLTRSMIWFGSRLIPDRLTPDQFRQEKDRAREKGVNPPSKKAVEKALREGGAALIAKDMNDLWYQCAPTIIRFAPEDRELAESLAR